MIQWSMMSFESCDWTLSMTYEIAWDSISFLFPSMKVVRERWQKSMRSIGGIFSFGAPWPRLDKVSTTMHIFKQCLSPCYVKMPIRVKHLWQHKWSDGTIQWVCVLSTTPMGFLRMEFYFWLHACKFNLVFFIEHLAL